MFSVLWRFRRILAGYSKQSTVGGVLILIGSALALALPWPLKIVVDNVLQDKPLTGLTAAVLGGSLALDQRALLWICVVAAVIIAASHSERAVVLLVDAGTLGELSTSDGVFRDMNTLLGNDSPAAVTPLHAVAG